MNPIYLLFGKFTGKPLLKNCVDYKSNQEIDESLFETISRLFFENRKIFYYLKNKIIAIPNKEKDALLLSVAGYFSYVDCDFMNAKKFFQQSIKLNPRDLELWFCLAFCFRQLGKEDKFNEILLHYDSIITDFMRTKNNNQLI